MANNNKADIDFEQTIIKSYDKLNEAHRVIPISLTPGGDVEYDTITATYPTAASEVYTYSLSGTPVKTVTVTYTDSTKENLLTVVFS